MWGMYSGVLARLKESSPVHIAALKDDPTWSPFTRSCELTGTDLAFVARRLPSRDAAIPPLRGADA